MTRCIARYMNRPNINWMDIRPAIVLAAVAVTLCFATEARPPYIVIGSTTFPLTDQVQKCLDILGLGVSRSTNPGGDMRKCLRQLRTTTRAPNETYFNNVDWELLVAEEGSTALLECQVMNLGGKEVSWTRRGEELSRMSDMYTPDRRFKMESLDSTFNIRIEGVEKWDAGKYKCGVRAKRSGTEIERIVELEVPTLPIIISMDPLTAPFYSSVDPDRRYFNRTSDVELYCNATGSPEPSVAWEKVQAGMDPIGVPIPQWGDTVLLANISKWDAGIYNCTASNGVGKVERSMEVIVQYKPTIKSPQTRIRAGRDEYTTLVCEIDAIPRAEIVWKRDKMPLLNAGQGSDRNSKQYTSYIIVRVDPDTDYGNYTCVASNTIGSSQLTIELHGRPLAPRVTSGKVSSRRHAYTLSWMHGAPSGGQPRQEIPVRSYVILFRGWWIERYGALQRVVYTHENPLREMVLTTVGTDRYRYTIRDLRPNTTYELVIYGRNQYGDGQRTAFTFYTANENAPSTPKYQTTTVPQTEAKKVTPKALQSGSQTAHRIPPTILTILIIPIVLASLCT